MSDKSTKVRVLADTDAFKCNEVVSLPADDAKAAVAAGWADADPEAVKYAEGLAKATAE